ncbi:hypothetical protein L7F22_066964 [Adiantum nelumboides]|nr:hypothetical protein [Adiantum nelumboides]
MGKLTVGMEGEDEEIEKLLGEILESNTQLDDLESAETTNPGEESYIVRSHSLESLQGVFQAFQPSTKFGCHDEEHAYASQSTPADGIVNADVYMGFCPPSKVLDVREQTTEVALKEVAAVSSLTAGFSNLKLEAGAPMQLNCALQHHTETPHTVSSYWHIDSSSEQPRRKYSRPDTDAFLDERIQVVPNGGYMHAYGRPIGWEHRGSLHSQCNGDPNLKAVGLESGIDRVHQAVGVQVMPIPPFIRQVPVTCSAQDAGVCSVFLDGKDSWQYNSKVVAYLQAQHLHKLNLQQQREGLAVDEVLAHFTLNSVDVDCTNGVSAFGRDHGYASMGVGSTLSCGYPPRQKLVNPYVDNYCACCTKDVCCSRENCSAFESKLGSTTTRNKAFQNGLTLFNNGLLKAPTYSSLYEEKPQVRILSKKSSRVAAPAPAPSVGWCYNNKNASIFGACKENSIDVPDKSRGQESIAKADWTSHKASQLTDAMKQGPYYSSLADIEGRIAAVAKDQHGCRFLQRKFDEGSREDVQKIFAEVLDDAVDLMVDPFGNYLIQKLLEVCTDDQRSGLLQSVTNKGELVNVSLNMHGTRAVQKLIETLKSHQHVAIVTASLRTGVVTLIKDLNGNHVIQRCLQHLSNEDNKFIFEAAARNCVEIATHRHGCCVLQRCIDHSTGVARQKLIWEIASNSLQLAQDSFGYTCDPWN